MNSANVYFNKQKLHSTRDSTTYMRPQQSETLNQMVVKPKIAISVIWCIGKWFGHHQRVTKS